ncbi:methylated-DNA--protein-cysteine methyltransferase, partial [Micromonospora sp. NPDC005313]
MSTVDSTVIDTPSGPLSVLAGPSGAVRAAGFTADPAALMLLIHPSLRGELRERAELGPVTAAVRAYLDGDLAAIDAVAVEQHTGGPFLTHAWRVLRDVKPGDPVTYTGFAALAGRPA